MTNNHIPNALPENAHDDSPMFTPDTPESYNPDDYRWVPVRRRPRYDGWTDEKQRRFIQVLADTGIVTAAAKAVGMSRESANRLRRSPHGAAFARAWDAARQYAGSALEDIAFERAIEGVEQNVFDEYGNVICTKRVYNDRLLTFLLGALKPERYGRAASERQAASPPPDAVLELDTSLRAMEPQLPAPPEDYLGVDTFVDELEIAEIADGVLPRHLSEQRPVKSAERLEAEAFAAASAHGAGALTAEAFKDQCLSLDPSQLNERGKKRFR